MLTMALQLPPVSRYARHGEMDAINRLSDLLNASGGASVYKVAPTLELYTSAEPCPMCAAAISWSLFGRVRWLGLDCALF